jgi:exopolyphosphatase/guanosine-5'-triphosphate,3'-diphosphate pyrophosphatase
MSSAALDIGSNTLRLLIGTLQGGSVGPLLYERDITRLGGEMGRTGRVGEKGLALSLEVLKKYRSLMEAHGVARYRAVGTSALREAANRAEVLRMVKETAGIDIEVVSGEEEAELTALGVTSSLRTPRSVLIADIGGGSTEMMFCRGPELVKRVTVPAGVVKMAEGFIRSDPPRPGELAALDEEAARVARNLARHFKDLLMPETVFVGTAGTATTLAAIDLALEEYNREKVHGHEISLERLRRMSTRLASLPLAERVRVKGLEPGREDLIIPGILLTITVMEMLNFRRVVISDHGLLEGVLLRLEYASHKLS